MNETDLDEIKRESKKEAYNEMLELSYEWKNNNGSFLDFQRVLRKRIEEL